MMFIVLAGIRTLTASIPVAACDGLALLLSIEVDALAVGARAWFIVE